MSFVRFWQSFGEKHSDIVQKLPRLIQFKRVQHLKETVLEMVYTLHSQLEISQCCDTSVGSASSTKKRTLGSSLKSHVDNTADSAESLTCPISPHSCFSPKDYASF